MNIQPPKWADRFLRWYCNPLYLEEIEGDIYELFERRVDGQNPKWARVKFVWDVFRFFRWSNVKRSNSKYITMNQFILFRNYLKLGMRNIRKNLVSSSINIFGLAIAICFAISIFIFTDMQLNMDSFHENGDRIYQVTNYIDQDGPDELWSDSPITLGPSLLADHPSVENFSRLEFSSANVKHESDVFDELVLFVDPGFFEMFSFPMINGNDQVLHDKKQMVISRDMAIKYFDEEDPIGQELSFKFTNGKIKRLVVGAVLDKYPYNNSFWYDFFLPIDNFFDLEAERQNDWSYLTDATFVMMKEGEVISSISDSYDDYVGLQQSSNPEWKVKDFHSVPLFELSKKSYMIESSVSGGGHPAGRITLVVISMFLLVMACFNFMNISVVSASKRLKEIALRKVMGSLRREIIKQFLVENILQCFFALIIGGLLAYFLLVPWFDNVVSEMEIKFRTEDPISLIIFFVALLTGVGIISGAYPAFYISKFDTITIFKGKEKFGSKNLFSKILLGFQFFLAVMTIVGCFILVEQSIYFGNKDWGYDPKGTMSIYVSSNDQYELLKNEVINHPDVNQHTASNYLIGRGLGTSSFEFGDVQFMIRRIQASEGYFETFRLRLKEGRLLTDRVSDQTNGVIVNERFVEAMGWEGSAIGKTFSYDSISRNVIGVVKDFHYYDFFTEIGPVMITGMNKERVRYLTVQTSPENLARLDEFAKTVWQEIAPNDPYDRVFQEDVFNGFYQENDTNIKLILLVTAIAIVLACLGLYGLLSFNVQGKLKEFSVRKVLGAQPRTIVKLMSKQYFWVLLISFTIGAPLGFLGMLNLVVTMFPDPKTITAIPFIIAMLIILVTLIITVAGQVNKAINVNPADLLKNE